MAIPISSLIFIFNGTVILWYAARSWRAWRAYKNPYSLMFFRMELGVGMSEYFLGIPTLLFPEASAQNGLFYLIMFFPLFLGLNESLKFVLRELGYRLTEKFVMVLVPVTVAVFFIVHLSALPHPYVDSLGLIHWDVSFPYDIIWAALLGMVTIIPAIFLIFKKVEGRGAFLKKILMATAFFFGGIGGIGVVLFDETTVPLFLFYLSQFVGFSFLGSIFLVDYFAKKEEAL